MEKHEERTACAVKILSEKDCRLSGGPHKPHGHLLRASLIA